MKFNNNQEFQYDFRHEKISLTIYFKFTSNKNIIFTSGYLHQNDSSNFILKPRHPPILQVQEIPQEVKDEAKNKIKKSKFLQLRAKSMNPKADRIMVNNPRHNAHTQKTSNTSHTELNFFNQTPEQLASISKDIDHEHLKEVSPTKYLQQKLKKNHKNNLDLTIPLTQTEPNEHEKNLEVAHLSNQNSPRIQNLGNSVDNHINSYLYQISGGITALISSLGYAFWLLNQQSLTLSNILTLGISGTTLSVLIGYCLDQFSKQKLSAVRQHRFMILAIQLNSTLSAISSMFLISVSAANIFNLIMISLMTTLLSAVAGTIYDIQVDRENHKRPTQA